ncbi:MAG: PHP domain-containing protein [Chitinispirillales bacterium]|jgi:predicted metal-dependent phosphoesterase TrpH|nr:PHP domain-containing protein [Chitinispirillales bacterium]
MEELLDVQKGNIDLHIHTRFSDGALTPEEVLLVAKKKGLSAISITDHDAVGAYPYVIEKGKESEIEVIPGVELSCGVDNNDIHILAYFFDYENKKLLQTLEEMRAARFTRAKKIVKNLNNLGIDLQFETVLRFAGNGSIGRPHIAEALLYEEFVYSYREAFEKYLGYDCPAYEDKMHLTPFDIFDLIKSAGGISVMAHPGITNVDYLIPELIDQGLCGLEVYHADHNVLQQKHYAEICKKNKLLFTGGSDFHRITSKIHSIEIGSPPIRRSLLDGLKLKYKEFL